MNWIQIVENGELFLINLDNVALIKPTENNTKCEIHFTDRTYRELLFTVKEIMDIIENM